MKAVSTPAPEEESWKTRQEKEDCQQLPWPLWKTQPRYPHSPSWNCSAHQQSPWSNLSSSKSWTRLPGKDKAQLALQMHKKPSDGRRVRRRGKRSSVLIMTAGESHTQGAGDQRDVAPYLSALSMHSVVTWARRVGSFT